MSRPRWRLFLAARTIESGRWALVVAAGTNGGYPIAKLYFQHGIDTVIYLHIDYNDVLKMQDEQLHGNLVILGHLSWRLYRT